MVGRGKTGLLLSSSVAALLIGGGAPAAFAACTVSQIGGPPVASVSNSTAIDCINVLNATVTGNVINTGTGALTALGGGAPSRTGITINNSSIGGAVSNAGIINATNLGIQIANGATVSGGIANSGALSSAGGIGILVDGVDSFSGGIVNGASGTLSAVNDGIVVGSVINFSGGVSNAGTIVSGPVGIRIGSAYVSSSTTIHATPVTTFTGGVTNTGTISAGSAGIWVQAASSFVGDIVNSASGVITGSQGIVVGVGTPSNPSSSAVLHAVSRFTGSIVNHGIITASGTAGIWINGVSTFQGDIVNQGTISGGAAGILVTGVSIFQGRISNAGTIMPGGFSAYTGIAVDGVGSFSGGITNTGTVFGGFAPLNAAIVVENVSAFSGGIVNQGSLAGPVGILITACGCGGIVSTFSGGIFNSGTIEAAGFFAGAGIVINDVATFLDGIHNTGMISAAGGAAEGGIGILVSNVEVFSGGIDNGAGGTVTATPGGPVSATPIGILVTNVATFAGDISNRGVIDVATTGIGIRVDLVTTFTGNIVNAGTIMAALRGIEITGPTSLGVGQMIFAGGISNGGLIAMSQPNSSVGIAIDGVSVLSGGVRNSGTITGGGVGIDICGCMATLAGGLTNTGLIAANFGGIVLSATSFFGNLSNAGTITVNGANPSAAAILISGTTFVDGRIVNTGTIGGPFAIDLFGAGNAVTIDQVAGLISGDIRLSPNGDTLNVRGGTINGNVVGQNAGDTINFALGAGAFTYGAAYGFSSVSNVNVLSGVVVLDGANQAGSIAVRGGVLQVGDASNTGATLTGSVDVIGGTLAGHGTIAGDVTVENGGVLFPGGSIGTLTIANGPLTFQPGSIYLLQIAPGAGNNSATAVTGPTGNVTINGGTVVMLPQLGHYNATTYTIVTTPPATGSVTGTFAGATIAAPFTFTGSETLSYQGGNDVFLNLADGYALLAPTSTNQNQQNVVNGINGFILGTGNNPPPQFANLPNLSGPALLNALTQLSGENSAGFFQGAFQAGNVFLNLMVNPFLDGRFGSGGGFGAAMGFAADEPPALPQAAAAFASAMPVKAMPAPAVFVPHYSAWGTAYGGSGRVTGDPAVGSHDTTARAAAFAAGIDYRASPNTVFGIALAGGGTSWDLTAGLGGGHSDMFQAGVYGSHHWGAAYLSGALSYNFHDTTTNRTLTIAGIDRLGARFQANGVGARLESGYRYATPWMGITPYAAVQAQSIALPSYGETATAGSNQFALNFASQTATTTRTELGAWLDRGTRLDSGALLTLYGRAAWAHDFGNTPAASAIFEALPGSNFVVNGAVPARDGALVTGAAQVSLANGWSFLAKFDGEFSSTTSIYSGSGMVKKTW